MTPAAERLHRLLLLLLAVLLLAGGVLVLLTGLGTFGSRLGYRAVFDNLLSRYVGDYLYKPYQAGLGTQTITEQQQVEETVRKEQIETEGAEGTPPRQQ